MSIEDLNNAASALISLGSRQTAFMDGVDEQLAARIAAYDDLAGDLVGVVSAQMKFSGTIDPDDPAPTNVDGGTFTDLATFCQAAPAGSVATALLVRDKVHPVTSSIGVSAGLLTLLATGAGANPILAFSAVVSGANKFIPSVNRYEGGFAAFISGVDIALPTVDPDPAATWITGSMSCFGNRDAGMQTVGFQNGTIFGGIAGTAMSLADNRAACITNLGLSTVVIDGPLYAVGHVNNGVAVVSTNSVTLQNGANVAEGGTLGVNLLMK